MKKERLISCLVLLGIVLGLPSVLYLIENIGNITGYTGEYFYFIGNQNEILTKLGAVIFFWTILLMFVIYIKLIKSSSQFQGVKNIMLSACIVGFAFFIALPNTSKDVFFYMGNGRVIDKYGENPYSISTRRSSNFRYNRCGFKNSW